MFKKLINRKKNKTQKVFLILIIIGSISFLIYFYFFREKEIIPPYFFLKIDQSKEYFEGDLIEAEIFLNTADKDITSANIILTYDSEFLEVLDSDENKEEIQISEGEIFQFYTGNSVNKTKGEVQLTAYSVDYSCNTHNKDEKFASIKFKALKPVRKTRVDFKFIPGSTTDSNIVETKTSQDVLNDVKNLSLKIKKR